MPNVSRRSSALRVALLAAGAAVFASSLAGGSTPISGLRRAGAARITIRGSGSAISIVRAAPSDSASGGEDLSLLDRTVRMKEEGTTDEALVEYLRAHRREIPELVDFDVMSRLRESGAGTAVSAYLASVAAVEIGPTGAPGGRQTDSSEPEAPPEGTMTNELPAALGWGGVVFGSSVARGSHRRAFPRRGASSAGTPTSRGFMSPAPRFFARRPGSR